MKKRIRNLIIILAILVVLLILVIEFNPMNRAVKRQEKINISDSMDDKLVLPKGLYKVMEVYDGYLTNEIVGKSYNNFATYIVPKYFKKCKNLSDDKLKRFYEKNSSIINQEIGIDNYEDFHTFSKYISKLQGDKLKFEEYRIIKESVNSSKSKLVNAYLAIKYSNNNEIVFNSTLSTIVNNKMPSIIFDTQYDEEYLEKEELLDAENEKIREKYNSNIIRGKAIDSN